MSCCTKAGLTFIAFLQEPNDINRLSRCCTARGSDTGFSLVASTKVKAYKSFPQSVRLFYREMKCQV